MLPFLKKPESASVALSAKKSVETKRKSDRELDYNPLKMIAEELIKSVHANDADGVAEAFKAAFQVCELYPHEEGSQE